MTPGFNPGSFSPDTTTSSSTSRRSSQTVYLEREEHGKNAANSGETPARPGQNSASRHRLSKIQVNAPNSSPVCHVSHSCFHFPQFPVTSLKHWESSQFCEDGQGQDQEWRSQSRQKDDRGSWRVFSPSSIGSRQLDKIHRN